MGRTKEEIRTGAIVFGQAAKTLGIISQAALKADGFIGKKILAQNVIPSIVLKAFSCELFIKSLIITNDIIRIHKLDELFFCLSDTDKNSIKNEVINKMASEEGQYVENDFNVDLEEVANAFVDWRYYYEDNRTIKIVFLDTLLDVLWNYAK